MVKLSLVQFKQKKYVNTCPDCHSNAFKPFGIGTQKVVEFINDELPQLKILRFDRDTTSGKDGHRKILSEFQMEMLMYLLVLRC